jgi:hypothetical protein
MVPTAIIFLYTLLFYTTPNENSELRFHCIFMFTEKYNKMSFKFQLNEDTNNNSKHPLNYRLLWSILVNGFNQHQ